MKDLQCSEKDTVRILKGIVEGFKKAVAGRGEGQDLLGLCRSFGRWASRRVRDSEKTGLLILWEMKGSVRYDRISAGSWSMLLGFSLVVHQSTGKNGGFLGR